MDLQVYAPDALDEMVAPQIPPTRNTTFCLVDPDKWSGPTFSSWNSGMRFKWHFT